MMFGSVMGWIPAGPERHLQQGPDESWTLLEMCFFLLLNNADINSVYFLQGMIPSRFLCEY